MGAVISYPDFTLSATLAGGSWTVGLPLNNLKTRFLAEKARTTSDAAASSTILVDLGFTASVRTIGMLAHNVDSTGTVRARGYSDSAYTTLVTGADTGAVSPYPAYDAAIDKNSIWIYADYMTTLQMALGTIPQDLAYDFNGDGVVNISDALIAMAFAQDNPDYPVQFPKNWIYCFSSDKAARYWKIEISNTNNLDGYIELGRLWIGSATFEPAVNVSYGISMNYESRDIITESLGGVLWWEKRAGKRTLSAQYDTLTAIEKQQALTMQRHLGLTGELLWINNSTATAREMIDESFLANLKSPSPIVNPYFDNYEMSLELLEII